jgi:hypothetical protein
MRRDLVVVVVGWALPTIYNPRWGAIVGWALPTIYNPRWSAIMDRTQYGFILITIESVFHLAK